MRPTSICPIKRKNFTVLSCYHVPKPRYYTSFSFWDIVPSLLLKSSLYQCYPGFYVLVTCSYISTLSKSLNFWNSICSKFFPPILHETLLSNLYRCCNNDCSSVSVICFYQSKVRPPIIFCSCTLRGFFADMLYSWLLHVLVHWLRALL